MKITIELPDTATVLGLFMNIRRPKETDLISTNWITEPVDGMTISVDPKTYKIKERVRKL